MSQRRTVLERVEHLARFAYGPRTRVVVYRDEEIGVWCVDLMSGNRLLRSISTSGSRGETLRATLEEVQEEARFKGLCPTCGFVKPQERRRI